MADYNPSIPQGGDNLSTSQAQMLNNFTQLNTIFAFDHYTWNDPTSADRGFHKQITFPVTRTDPALTGTQGMLYTKTVSGLAQLFFANSAGVAAVSGITGVISQNGSLTFPNGLVFKWGAFSMGAGVTSSGDISFAGGQFPSNLFSILISGSTANSGNTAGVNLAQTNLIKFQAFRSASPASASSYYYFAVGN